MNDWKSWAKGIGALLGIALSLFWIIDRTGKATLGSTGNNGYTGAPPAPSPELQAKMQDMWKKRDRTQQVDITDPGQQLKARMEMAKRLTPKEQEEMRRGMEEMQKRMEKSRAVLGPQGTRRVMEKFRGAFQRRFAENDGPPAPSQ